MAIKIFCLVVSVLSLANIAHSKTVNFVDQNNQPIEHVVVTSKSLSKLQTNNFGHIMNQVNKQFSPRVLAVQTGQLVEFPNSDNIRHHIYSFSDAKPFEVKLYSGEEAPPVMFDTAGVVVLGCNIHDQMLGYIYVSDATQAWISNSKGYVELPNDIDEFEFWHPDISLDHMQKGSLRFEGNRIVLPTEKHGNPNSMTVLIELTGKSLKPAVKSRVFGGRKFSQGEH